MGIKLRKNKWDIFLIIVVLICSIITTLVYPIVIDKTTRSAESFFDSSEFNRFIAQASLELSIDLNETDVPDISGIMHDFHGINKSGLKFYAESTKNYNILSNFDATELPGEYTLSKYQYIVEIYFDQSENIYIKNILNSDIDALNIEIKEITDKAYEKDVSISDARFVFAVPKNINVNSYLSEQIYKYEVYDVNYNLKLYYNLIFLGLCAILIFVKRDKITIYSKLKTFPLDLWVLFFVVYNMLRPVLFMSQGVATFYDNNIAFLADLENIFRFSGSGEQLIVHHIICRFIHIICWFVMYFIASNIIMYIIDLVRWTRRRKSYEYTLVTKIFLKRFNEIRKNYFYKISLIDKRSKMRIFCILVINCIIIYLLMSFLAVTVFTIVLYAIFTYLITIHWYTKVTDSYRVISEATKEIADGNLNKTIEDVMVFNDLKDDLLKIKDGFKQAVTLEVKAEKMKTELITNVSHDLKTPLTAIITYADLLKTENLSEQDKNAYLSIIDKKATRLAVIIEDLFEVSKIASGNILLEYNNVNIVHLIDQTIYELENEVLKSGITIKKSSTADVILCNLDSLKMHRVFDNILINITKYGLSGTRAFINIVEETENVFIEFKNISKNEINFTNEQIVERFTRGDESRSTEGSGLGLAICKNFVEAHGGSFKISTDGDLFKAVIKIPK